MRNGALSYGMCEKLLPLTKACEFDAGHVTEREEPGAVLKLMLPMNRPGEQDRFPSVSVT